MAIGLAALLAAAVLAQATATAAGAAEAPAATAKPEKPKKICVEEAQLGSLFKKRICATQDEWDRRRERDAAEMARVRASTR